MPADASTPLPTIDPVASDEDWSPDESLPPSPPTPLEDRLVTALDDSEGRMRSTSVGHARSEGWAIIHDYGEATAWLELPESWKSSTLDASSSAAPSAAPIAAPSAAPRAAPSVAPSAASVSNPSASKNGVLEASPVSDLNSSELPLGATTVSAVSLGAAAAARLLKSKGSNGKVGQGKDGKDGKDGKAKGNDCKAGGRFVV